MSDMTWDMIGHEWAVDLLCEHIRRSRIQQAYLITGADGLGKRTLGLRLTQALCCTNPPEIGERCGECRACRLIQSGEYPDLHVIQSETIGGQLKVEQIRELSRQLALAPFEGKLRVALLLRFHEANENAANALLKTLEEPASQVVLILTARSKEALLPTIVSRCEVIPLRQVSETEVQTALQDRGATPQNASLFASLADGRPGWAIRHFEDQTMLDRRAQLLDELMELVQSTRAGRFQYLEAMLEKKDTEAQRQAALEALDHWSSLWRDAMLSSFHADKVNLRNIDRVDDIRRLAGELETPVITHVLQEAEATRAAIERNVNVRLALETWLLDVPKLGSEVG
jgi:DNA polymerase-3 subunit delta'